MDRERVLKVLTDYTEFPGPRYIKQDQRHSSGEEFYITKLNPMFAECLREKDKLVVNLDGTSGYPSSFLDESFGQLVYDFTKAVVSANVKIISARKKWPRMIEEETFPEWESRRLKRQVPLVSQECEVFCLDENGQIVTTKRTQCL